MISCRRFCRMDSTLFGITPPGDGWVMDLLQKPQNSLRWRHNGYDSVSNHQPHHCLLNRLFGCRSKKTSKLRVTGICAGPVNSPQTWPVTRKCSHFMTSSCHQSEWCIVGYGSDALWDLWVRSITLHMKMDVINNDGFDLFSWALTKLNMSSCI